MKKIVLILSFFFISNIIFSQTSSYLHFNKIIAKIENNKMATGIWVSALHPSNAIGLIEFNG